MSPSNRASSSRKIKSAAKRATRASISHKNKPEKSRANGKKRSAPQDFKQSTSKRQKHASKQPLADGLQDPYGQMKICSPRNGKDFNTPIKTSVKVMGRNGLDGGDVTQWLPKMTLDEVSRLQRLTGDGNVYCDHGINQRMELVPGDRGLQVLMRLASANDWNEVWLIKAPTLAAAEALGKQRNSGKPA